MDRNGQNCTETYRKRQKKTKTDKNGHIWSVTDGI